MHVEGSGWGVSRPTPRGVYPSMHWGRHPPPPSRRLMLQAVHILLECILDASNFGILIFTAHKRSLGEGNVFTRICHSVHRGVPSLAAPLGWQRTTPSPSRMAEDGTPIWQRVAPSRMAEDDTPLTSGPLPTGMLSCLNYPNGVTSFRTFTYIRFGLIHQ